MATVNVGNRAGLKSWPTSPTTVACSPTPWQTLGISTPLARISDPLGLAADLAATDILPFPDARPNISNNPTPNVMGNAPSVLVRQNAPGRLHGLRTGR